MAASMLEDYELALATSNFQPNPTNPYPTSGRHFDFVTSYLFMVHENIFNVRLS